MIWSKLRAFAFLLICTIITLNADDNFTRKLSGVDDFRILPDKMMPDNYPDLDRGFWKRPDRMHPFDGTRKKDRCKALIEGRMYQDILELVQKDKDQILTKQLELTALKLAYKAAKKKETSIEKYLAFHENDLRNHPISLELLEKYKKHFLPTDARVVKVDMLYFENLYPSEKTVDNEKLSAFVLASIMKNESRWGKDLQQIIGPEKTEFPREETLLIDRISLIDFNHSTNLDFRDAAILRILGFSQEVAGNYEEPSVSRKVSEILDKVSGFTDEEKTLSLSGKISEVTKSLKADFTSVKEKFIDEYLDCIGNTDREAACRDLDSVLLPNFEKAMQEIIQQLGNQEAFSETSQGKITLGSKNGSLKATIDLNKPIDVAKKTPLPKPKPIAPPPAPPKAEDFSSYRCNGVPPTYRTDVMAPEEDFSFTDFMKNCGWGSLKGLMKELFLTDSGVDSTQTSSFDNSSKLNIMQLNQKLKKEDFKNFEDLIKEDQYDEVEPYVDEVTKELYEIYKSKLSSASASEIHSLKMSLGGNVLSGLDESRIDAIATRDDFLVTASNLSLNPLVLLDAIERKSKEFLLAAKNVFDQMKIIYPGFFTLSCWDGQKIGLEFCELIGATLGSTLRNLAIAIPIGLIAAPATAGGSLAVAIQSAAMKAMMEQAAGKLGDVAVNFTSHAVSRMVSYSLAKGEGETKRLNMEKISAVIEKTEFFNKIFGIANPNEIKNWLKRPGQIANVQNKIKKLLDAINFIGSTTLGGVELDQAIEEFKKTMPELNWDEIKSWTILDKS